MFGQKIAPVAIDYNLLNAQYSKKEHPPMTSIPSKIMSYAESLPEGTTLSAKELLHFGSRPAVDQALSRLTKNSDLLRIGSGIYVKPVHSRYGLVPPISDLVIKDIKDKSGDRYAPTGLVSANKLGLTTQNPVIHIILTSGRSQNLYFGKRIVKLRHAPGWQLDHPDSLPGHLVRALTFMGKYHAKWAIEKIADSINPADRETILSLRPKLPSWMAMEISRLAN